VEDWRGGRAAEGRTMRFYPLLSLSGGQTTLLRTNLIPRNHLPERPDKH
jgi:hypothetical protein